MSDYLIHYGVKGMKWGVRHDKRIKNKYLKKAKAQAEYQRDLNQSYIDDPELWNTLTALEKREMLKSQKAASKHRNRSAENWEKKVKRIEKAKTGKEAKEIYKEKGTDLIILGRKNVQKYSGRYDIRIEELKAKKNEINEAKKYVEFHNNNLMPDDHRLEVATTHAGSIYFRAEDRKYRKVKDW